MNRGFSLVELSIVLVILGLLTGGILAGQSLIRAAELRSISSDVNRYTAATNSFRDKYFALPGDMANATQFWTAVNPTPATCQATQGTGTQTCDGNGDGKIGELAASCYERHRFWQHLANAGLIEGQYSGIAGSAGNCHSTLSAATPNAPRSKISNAGFSVTGNQGNISGNPSYFDGFFSTRFFFGRQNDAMSSSLWGEALKPEEAWNIDTKMDDGKPATGSVQTFKNGAVWSSPNCATTATSAAEYALSVSSVACALMFQTF